MIFGDVKMITKFKQQINMPYSLHDMIVKNITYQNGSIFFTFEHGFVSTEKPCTRTEGKITIENVDMDSACVLLLSKMGKYGKFDGMKISLNDFIERYDKYYFEIIDEMYGFNQVEYIGYLQLPNDDNSIQMSLSIYFYGSILYETDDL